MSTINVLLVDDDTDAMELYRTVLADLQVNLMSARSGEEALGIAKDTEFAAIVLDIQMSGIDGYETALRLRNLEKARQTPIIFVTGNYKDEQSAARGYALGAADYITKPFKVDAFHAKVSAYVDLYRRTRKVMEQLSTAIPVAARDKILVAQADIAQIIRNEDWAEKLGIELLSAGTIQEAKSLLLKNEVALVLLGSALADGDGMEVAQYIRQNEQLAATPILLFCAAPGGDELFTRGYELGVVDILNLPVNPALLRAKAKALLDQFRQIRTLKLQYREIDRLKQEIESTRKQLSNIETELDRLATMAI